MIKNKHRQERIDRWYRNGSKGIRHFFTHYDSFGLAYAKCGVKLSGCVLHEYPLKTECCKRCLR